jgi:phosphoribosylformylglycinamidine synthase PurS subunit
MFKAEIFVSLKESVLDPQGVAVKSSLHSLGFQKVSDVRIGKRLEMMLECDSREEAEKQVRAMCEKMLANPTIENYTFEVERVS